MKRMIALFLICSLLLCSCTTVSNYSDTTSDTMISINDDTTKTSFTGLNDPDILPYLSDQAYYTLEASLDKTEYKIEDVESIYRSKEYIEELEFNSKENVYFGFTLSEIAEQFDGTSYVYALNDKGETIIQEVISYDDTYDKVIKNVAIGTGVILISVTVALITKNPASAVGANKTIKAIFAISSTAAKHATIGSFTSSLLEGSMTAFLEALKTKDLEQIAKAGLLGASEGYKWGAIFGALDGTVDGIRTVGNTKYFKDGTKQAEKYWEGIEFTKGKDGEMHPRFEKWAIETAKFDKPTLQNALNHTGLSGDYYYDKKLANMQVGLKDVPEGYVWHHVEDMQTLILIPKDLHNVSSGGMPHVGGASLIEQFLGIKN